jgi:tRNA(fMet)-specific endonuclease VapC
MRYLLDSNICVYALKNRPPKVLRRLEVAGRATVAVSVIAVLELRQGFAAARGQARISGSASPMCLVFWV